MRKITIPAFSVCDDDLPAPAKSSGWEWAGPFMRECYAQRLRSERREAGFVRDTWEDLTGKEVNGTPWQTLKARIYYELHRLGFERAGRAGQLSKEFWQSRRAAWTGQIEEGLAMTSNKFANAVKGMVKQFQKREKPAAPAKALPKKAAAPAKRLSLLKAAMSLLTAKPQSAAAIYAAITAKKLWAPKKGKTPIQTLRVALMRAALAKKGVKRTEEGFAKS